MVVGCQRRSGGLTYEEVWDNVRSICGKQWLNTPSLWRHLVLTPILMRHRLWIGTAGWTIPKQQATAFAADGTHLTRYAQQLRAVEINSSFHRPHRPSTYARWAATVPAGLRFAVKMPREVTHTRRLSDASGPLARFLWEVKTLGAKSGLFLCSFLPVCNTMERWRSGSSWLFVNVSAETLPASPGTPPGSKAALKSC